MDATTMPSMHSLLPRLEKDFKDISFTPGDTFAWSPSRNTVIFNPDEDNSPLLIHELAHGILDHHRYTHDVELLAMESQAWDKAVEIAQKYGIEINQDIVQDNLDTYRQWLHDRSTCPTCEATGYQTGKNTYECPACAHTWRVNEARLCALRRYSKN